MRFLLKSTSTYFLKNIGKINLMQKKIFPVHTVLTKVAQITQNWPKFINWAHVMNSMHMFGHFCVIWATFLALWAGKISFRI